MHPGVIARETPDKVAVVLAETGEWLSYAELDERSTRLAHVLRDTGLGIGDHIALLAENHTRYFEVYWAALRSGLYITPVNRHLSAEEAAYIVHDSAAEVVIVSGGQRALAESLIETTPRVCRRLAFDGPVAGHETYEDVLAAAPVTQLVDQPRGAPLLYSSGTTGRPKGIELALSGTQADDPEQPLVRMVRSLYGMDADTRYLSPAPLYHAAPLGYSAAVHSLGGTVVLMRHFDAEEALRAIERYRVTHSQWVPTMFVRMLKLPASVRNHYDLTSLRVAIHAAAPCPMEIKRAVIDWWGPVLHEYYASSEMHGPTHIDSAEWLAKPGSVGRAVLGTLRVCDEEDGRELPAGQTGLVYFERPDATFSYRGDPDKTRDARHPERPDWNTVGDIGYVDGDGYLFLTDRRTNLIISGGVNVYPQEVENVLVPHPGVADAAVFGVPDPEMGERVHAVVEAVDPAEAGNGLAEELIAYLRERIAHFKVPAAIDFAGELPRTPTGKMRTHLLREQYAPGSGG